MSTQSPPRTFHFGTVLACQVLVAGLGALVVLALVWTAGMVLVALGAGGDGVTLAPGPLPSPQPLPGPQ